MTPRSPLLKALTTLILCIALGVVSGCASVAPGGPLPEGAVAPSADATTRSEAKPRIKPSSPSAGATMPLQTYEISTAPVAVPTIDLTAETEDILQRIRNGFAMPDINNDLVLAHQQWYLNRPDYLRRMVERSSPFLHHIVEEIEKRGMPMELALLPMVESAYNPSAYSRAKASGLWQFIPATGKRYKLDQNWWKDERRDIVASTAAALEYLQSIYEMHGDWHLALASYNWGEGAVAKAVNKNRALDLPTDYLSLTMPRETQNYVPKLQALKNIFSNPTLLSELGIPQIPNRPYFATISKSANIDVKVAAQLAGMPVQEFVALNPAHNRAVIVSDSPMVIPAEKVDNFVSNLEAHEENNKPLSAWQSYTLRPGDRLESVAPRFGMSVANLKAANGIKGRIRVTPGLTLLVARHGGADMAPLPGQPRLPEADPEPAARRHTVAKGETLPGIARRYDISLAELRRLNNLKSDTVSVGTRLLLASAAKPATRTDKPVSKSPIKLAPRPVAAKPGTTASKIAPKPAPAPAKKPAAKK
ncbi:transglycosylase SLT domain-containing protein [Propionivibrio dicarboxylicus]|uniref:Membrane-bound lytic murein transglycosylase D n=1 Tax=Propionivibrio dicarboxylicus TaxID=83767 RepID=A0A1G8G551_9RHOO|nr:transglycosylase SLT domain-containing protein [Propionivibrio dicarboxylicus]SDH89507.1 membrane-bound lytic murein transglycosylase D [Propionivibrio dicarboxylicus]